jgi:hypothetical protein
LEPPLNVQLHPDGVGVSFHGLDDEVPPDAVEELLDVEIDHPVLLPAALPAAFHRVQGRFSGPVAVGVLVERRVHADTQMPGHHGLGNTVSNSRNS